MNHLTIDADATPPDAATDGVWLRCIGCGADHAPFDEILYRCPTCDSLLEVRYDALPTWDDFDGRGVWRYAAGLPVPTGVSIDEGDTPLYAVPDLADEVGIEALAVKHEGMNPTGSFKDRGMTVGVAVARQLGVGRLGCASTGNTSAALAAYGARAGMDVVVLLPEGKVAAGKLAQAGLHGAKIFEVAGNFDACLDVVDALASQGEMYLLNSINPYRLEGQKTIGLEIMEAWQDRHGRYPDRIILPVGNAGNTSALYKAFRELVAAGAIEPDEVPKLTGVQASGAAPLVEAIEQNAETVTRWDSVSTRATAIRIGNPVNWPKALPGIRETGGTAVAVEDEQITDAQRSLAQQGIGVEPASAASLAGLRVLRDRGVVTADEHVVCLTTGHLLKDPDAAAAAGTDPIAVAADPEAVIEALGSPISA